MSATGVQTNGVGNVTTAHLNLTRTMADVLAEERPKAKPRAAARRGRPPGPREQTKITYAGASGC